MKIITLRRLFIVATLIGLALLPLMGTIPTARAGTTYTVTTNADSGLGSFRDALTQVNLGSYDTITFNAAYTLTPASNFPTIIKSVTINANGATLQGQTDVRGLTIQSGTVSIDSLTITAGNCTTSCTVLGDSGGGIFNNNGTLTVTNSTLSGNSAQFGGGGIFNNNGTLTVTNSTLSGNSAQFGGGGIFNSSGTLTVTNSTLSGNSARNSGGGILNGSGTLTVTTVTNSTLSGNSATDGGGILNLNNGMVTVTNSTLSGNSATNHGGGINNSFFAVTTVTNSTLSGNSASAGNGGGIFNNNGTLTLTNSIVANSPSGGDCGGPRAITPTGLNIVDDASCGSTNIMQANPQLAALANNGGPTQTFALLTGSPAIGAATCAVTTDQRGQPRKPLCDIGAYETRIVTVAASFSPASVVTSGTSTLSLKLTNAAGDPAVNVIGFTLTLPTGLTVASVPAPPHCGGAISSSAMTVTLSGGSLIAGLSSCTLSVSVTSATAATYTIDQTTLSGATIPFNNFTVSLTVTAAPATHFSVSGFTSPVTAGTAGTITVQARDATNNPTTNYSGTVQITSIDPAAVLPGNAPLSGGVGTFSVTLKTAGTQTITATDTGNPTITGSQTGIMVNPSAPATLVFTQQPTNTAAGATITPAVTVAVEDTFNNVITTSTASITLAISSSTLNGTLSVNAVNGVATFSNLSVNTPSTYTLMASSGALTSPPSNNFTISAGAPTKLAFVQQPSNTAAGVTIAPSVTVQVLDAFNNVVTTSTASITLAISSSTLNGTLSVNAVNGVATFSNLSVNTAGTNYTLTATGASLSVTSNPFTISAGTAAKLGFVQQPSNTAPGAMISPPVTVAVEDTFGNVVMTNNTASITLTISPLVTLNGTLTMTAVSGVATFNNLSVNTAGTYMLTASSSPLTPATSGTFTISVGVAARLAFGQQPPTTAVAGATLMPAVTVQVLDTFNNLVTSDNGTMISLTISAPGTLNGIVTASTVNGVATFSNLSVPTVGTYTLTAASTNLTSITSGNFTINAGAAAKLVFVQQPINTAPNAPITPAVTVAVEDAFNNAITTSTASITLAISAPGTLNGTVSANAVNGVATFSNLSVPTVGTYTLSATSGALTNTTSAPFTISVGVAARLAFGQPPTTAVAGTTLTPAVTVQVLDTFNNLVTTSTAPITLTISSGTLNGTLTVNAVNGVATFSNLSENAAGTYTLTASSPTLTSAAGVSFTISPMAAIVVTFPPPPPIPLCSDSNGSTNGIVRATIPSGTVTNGSVFCRIIAKNSAFVESASEVGIQSVLDRGVIQAVDVFGLLSGGQSVIPFNNSVQICLQGSGAFLFIDANHAPRSAIQLPTTAINGYACANIPNAGTVVLTNGAALNNPTASNSVPNSAAPKALSLCVVTSTAIVNLHGAPNASSSVLGLIPFGTKLSASAVQGGWYQVTFSGASGWVSAQFVTTFGQCG